MSAGDAWLHHNDLELKSGAGMGLQDLAKLLPDALDELTSPLEELGRIYAH